MNANTILEWIKHNLFSIVFLLVAVAALVILPTMAARMNAQVQQDLASKARKINELQQLERTTITIPGGGSRTGVVNQRLLESLRRTLSEAGEDAERIVEAAIEHNRKGRTVLMPEVFPSLPRERAEVLPREFHERLLHAYEDLLVRLNAGSPPGLETLSDEIHTEDVRFRWQTFVKEPGDQLTPEELQTLTEHLANLRLMKYEEAAANLLFYVSLDELTIPYRDPGRLPTMGELFEWQWQFWIQHDILKALAEANLSSGMVLTAPVKRVLSLHIEPSAGVRSGDGGYAPSPSPMPMPRGGGAPPAVRQDIRPVGPPVLPSPATAVPVNYAASLTGRITNPLYDVRYVDLDLIVDSTRLPQVIEALSRYNFITVTHLRLSPADSYEAAQHGYYYGSGAAAHVFMRLETIWLRAWTAHYMPAEVRSALGIQSGSETPDHDPDFG